MIRPSSFKPAWWLRNRHLQTVFANSLLRRVPKLALVRETIELPDGDFLHIDWAACDEDRSPVVLLLHGLEGSSQSRYATSMLDALRRGGYRAGLMHFRGCSGIPNRLQRSYHAGETNDVDFVLNQIGNRYPDVGLAAIGYSLGGNILLKWLGEQRTKRQLATAIAISVPFDLQDACHAIDSGLSQFYRHLLLKRLRASLKRKFPTGKSPVIDVGAALKARSFLEFDDLATSRLHGFASAYDYYWRCSSRQYLESITIPTLILHSRDDPFMTPAAVPDKHQLAPAVTLELSERGGHVGFVSGSVPWKPLYWLEQRVLERLSEQLRPA